MGGERREDDRAAAMLHQGGCHPDDSRTGSAQVADLVEQRRVATRVDLHDRGDGALRAHRTGRPAEMPGRTAITNKIAQETSAAAAMHERTRLTGFGEHQGT